MTDIKDMVWQEKYRPNTVRNVVSVHTKKILKALENPKSIQHYIFYSTTGGTGKSSMARAIINDLGCDVLSLNASDERSIDVIRTKVKDFMMTVSANKDSKKCVYMDEGEKLTNDARDAIKNIMETYSSNCFIILTTNDIHKLPGPLQSRFEILEFSTPDKKDIFDYLKNICEQENLSFEDEGLNKIINNYYPSIRRMVNTLQDLKNQGVSVSEDVVCQNDNEFNKIFVLIKNLKYDEVKRIIIEQGIDSQELNKHIFNELMKSERVSKEEVKLLPILARNERDFYLGADKNIVFICSVIDMIKIYREVER